MQISITLHPVRALMSPVQYRKRSPNSGQFIQALYELTWVVASSFPFSLEGERKRFLLCNQSFFVISPIKSIPFLTFSRNHLRSTLGITCGRGSFAVHLGIICGLRIIFGWGSFAVLYIQRYKWQTSNRTCIKVVLEKSAFSTLLTFYFISFLAKWVAVHSLVLFILTPSHIIATRVGLHLSCMTHVLKKNSLTSAIKWLATKKDLGPFKIDRAVVDSIRSVNLLFNIRKIRCTYPRKRKDIQMFPIGDLSSFLAGGWLASGADICLFHGRVVEKTRLHRAFWWTILFQLSSICLNSRQILETKARIFVWHWTKSLYAWSQ